MLRIAKKTYILSVIMPNDIATGLWQKEEEKNIDTWSQPM